MATRRGSVKGSITNPGTWWALFLGGTAVVGAALAEYFLRPHPMNWVCFAVGAAIGVSSFALRGWAAAHLSAYWSMHIEVRKDHPLIQGGPYAWVRHPIYTAAGLELLGAILMLQSWWSLLAFGLLFVPALTGRIVLEERAMIAHFGDTYRTYMANTPALVRFLPPGRNRAP
jgi:protein-S-isoprenylcysteine O-methyltransferase Ste14